MGWDSWGEMSTSCNNQSKPSQDAYANNIDENSKYSTLRRQESQPEEDPDFFQDMTPSVKRPKKVQYLLLLYLPHLHM